MDAADMVKLARQGMGLTQVELAERLRVRPLAVSRWERGERRPSWHVRYVLRDLYEQHKARGPQPEKAPQREG